MATFPKVQSPCPYKGDLSAIMEGDTCRLCQRRVFDLSAMSDAERTAFMSGCAEEVCVSYRFPVRTALAAAMTGLALGAPMAAAAQDLAVEEDVIIVGGIKDPANVEYVSDDADGAASELPVVYEDEAETEAAEEQSGVSARNAAPDLGHGIETE